MVFCYGSNWLMMRHAAIQHCHMKSACARRRGLILHDCQPNFLLVEARCREKLQAANLTKTVVGEIPCVFSFLFLCALQRSMERRIFPRFEDITPPQNTRKAFPFLNVTVFAFSLDKLYCQCKAKTLEENEKWE